jgi:hypothetical protein
MYPVVDYNCADCRVLVPFQLIDPLPALRESLCCPACANIRSCPEGSERERRRAIITDFLTELYADDDDAGDGYAGPAPEIDFDE